MANRNGGGGGGGRDRDRYSSDDDRDDRSPPRDRVGRYRGGGGGGGSGSNSRSHDGSSGSVGMNLNVEQMISMVFEMRGTLAHEVEARKSLEAQLFEARGSIESLRELGSRETNKWSNLLARVKELEVGSKLDNRLMDLHSRADKFSRNADQTKIVGVFQDMKARMDAQERDYRESINRLGREQMRDASRLDSELKNYIDAQLGKMEQRLSGDIDGLARLSNRVVEIEKEFGIFLNTQMQLQLSMANKEKDGDWLKIYLTENFQAQKAATEIKFAEVATNMERLEDKARNIEEKSRSDLVRTTSDLTDSLADERVARDASVKKLQKSLKLSFTNLGENLKSMCGGLDSKIERIKATQNEAISSLHRLTLEADARFKTHQQAFEDMVALQSTQTSSTHALSQRLDALEEVLKAEIKSRIKNYQKTKLQGMELAKGFEARIHDLKAFLVAEAEVKAKADAALRVEEEEHAKLLHIAMETRSVLDSMVGQVEEQHYVDLRRNEWKAFGQVIELELSSRDQELDRKLAGLADPNSNVGRQVEELKSFVSEAFREFEAHERLLKAEEEEQAGMMHIAMETRAVLDSLVDHIVDVADARVLATLDANVRSLHQTSAASEDQIHALKNLMEAGHDSTAAQLAATHTEIMKMASDLAAQIDAHSSHLEDLGKSATSHSKDLIAIKSQVEEAADLQATQTRDVASLKSTVRDLQDGHESLARDIKTQKTNMLDVQDSLASQGSSLKLLQSSFSDQSAQVQHHRAELEQKLHTKVNEATTALSSSSIRIDEMSLVIKRLEGHDRANTEMSASIDQLASKQSKLDASFIGLQDRLDESALSADKKIKELRDKLEQDFEEQEAAIKKVDKKLHTHMEEFAGLAGDFAARSGGLSTASKTTEEQVIELRSKLSTLSTLPVQLDALKSEMKEVHGRLDSSLSVDRHARDLKDLQSALHDASDIQAKDTKVLRESIQSIEEATTKREKSIQDHLHEIDQKLRAGAGSAAGKDDPKGASSKQVDASHVDREVSRVQENIDALARKLKDQSNLAEDSLNRVSQDLKKLSLKVEGIESGGLGAVGAAKVGPHGLEDGSAPAKGKAVSELSLRVEQLESELKLKTLPALVLQVDTLASKTETRAKEVDAKLAAHESRFERLDADIKAAVLASDEVDAKQNKRVKELTLSIEAQSARDLEVTNALKSEAASRALEFDLLIKASEARSHTEIKTLQKQMDAYEIDMKAHSRAVDEKLHDMAWSLEYAKDEMFKKDAKEIRQGAAPPPPQHPKPQPAPEHHAGHHAAAPSSSENYEDDEKSQKDSQR